MAFDGLLFGPSMSSSSIITGDVHTNQVADAFGALCYFNLSPKNFDNNSISLYLYFYNLVILPFRF